MNQNISIKSETKPQIGLLPLYLKLYDDANLRDTERVDGFYNSIANMFTQMGLEVITVPVCRIEDEFKSAVKKFEEKKACAIVTLHLAYSPSLESIDALASTKIPIIVCDTTPTYAYGPEQNPDELMFNHGIHGVQDMCNLLIRRGKPFLIEAGHWEESNVLERVVRHVKSTKMFSQFHGVSVGLIGEPFKGMGDFFVSQDKLKSDFGIKTVAMKAEIIKNLIESVSAGDIEREMESDRDCFLIEEFDNDIHVSSVKTQLALEKWIQLENLGAFSFNFLNIDSSSGFETVPFLAASKLMAGGIGYGGEGDLLTAVLVHSLSSVFTETSFTEMFCPDWEENRIFLSHMGEFNYTLAEGKARLLEMDYGFSDVKNPLYAAGRFKQGEILLVNLLPLKDGYRLIIAPAVMLAVKGKDAMQHSVHGWFKPKYKDGNIGEFLAQYSRYGGTHHLAVSYGNNLDIVKNFGKLMGFDIVVIT